MSLLPRVRIIGYLSRDPEQRTTRAGKPMLNLSIPTSRTPKDGAEITTWWRVSLYGQDAEFWGSKLTKGDRVLVEGDLEVNTYAGNDGATKTSLDIIPWGIRIESLSTRPQAGNDEDAYDVDSLPF